MNGQLTFDITKYYSKGILVDTNLLLVLLVGLQDENLINKCERTSKYQKQDFRLLGSFLNNQWCELDK
jgi:hypothetical protein